jgi:N utilization substance protein B
MGARRNGREAALQLLYQIELSGDRSETAVSDFWSTRAEPPPEERDFAERLVKDVLARLDSIDSMISACADNWQIDRISRMELNVLRIGVSELTDADESVPAEVVVNEAVDIARRYCDASGPAFVNGVLDRVARDQGAFSNE